jgi:hypothetical protein
MASIARGLVLERLGRLERLKGGAMGSTGDGGALWLGVDRVGKRGKGFGRGEGLHRATFSPSCPTRKDKGKGFPTVSRPAEERGQGWQGVFYSYWSLCKKREERKKRKG